MDLSYTTWWLPPDTEPAVWLDEKWEPMIRCHVDTHGSGIIQPILDGASALQGVDATTPEGTAAYVVEQLKSVIRRRGGLWDWDRWHLLIQRWGEKGVNHPSLFRHPNDEVLTTERNEITYIARNPEHVPLVKNGLRYWREWTRRFAAELKVHFDLEGWPLRLSNLTMDTEDKDARWWSSIRTRQHKEDGVHVGWLEFLSQMGKLEDPEAKILDDYTMGDLLRDWHAWEPPSWLDAERKQLTDFTGPDCNDRRDPKNWFFGDFINGNCMLPRRAWLMRTALWDVLKAYFELDAFCNWKNGNWSTYQSWEDDRQAIKQIDCRLPQDVTHNSPVYYPSGHDSFTAGEAAILNAYHNEEASRRPGMHSYGDVAWNRPWICTPYFSNKYGRMSWDQIREIIRICEPTSDVMIWWFQEGNLELVDWYNIYHSMHQ